MDVTNNLPESYIVGETKLNAQTFERFLKESGKTSILDEWNKKNSEQTVSGLEQHFEFLSRVYGMVDGEKTNDEALKDIISNPSLQYIFDHGQINIMFKNVSMNFMVLLLRLKIESLQMINERISLEEMGFWLPPVLDDKANKDLSIKYAGVYAVTSNKINELLDEINYESIKQETPAVAETIRSIFTRLMPISSQINLGLTCTVRGWRQLILMGGNFSSDDELRFVFMHLARDMKKRYYGVFQDLSLEDEKGQRLGLDTLRNEGAWKKYQIAN